MISQELIENIQNAANKINRDEYSLLFAQSERGLGLEPIFKHKECKNITPIQKDVFGIYTIRNICRGCFLSINHILGGQVLLQKKLYAPSLTSIYAGDFHLLHSLLAKHGKIVEPLNYLENGNIIEHKSCQVYATFSTNDKIWHFNKISIDHKKKWRLINDLFQTKEYPTYFDPLFKYWFGYLTKEKLTTQEYLEKLLNDEYMHRYSFNEKINEFIYQFVEFRHMASYRSFGGDIFFYDYVINSKSCDLVPDKMDNHCQMYLQFSFELMNDVIQSIKYLLSNINILKKYRRFLWGSINQPPFDKPNINMLNNEIKADIKKIADWFNS
jgi:hypothetical protein